MITDEMKARIFGLYWGCEVSYLYLLGDTHREGSGRVVGIYMHDDAWVLDLMDWQGAIYPTDVDENQCRLMLMRLSDIADEHINGAWDASGIGEHIIDNSKESFLRMFDPSKCAESDERLGQAIYLKVYDYLRSKFYALPYENIDLFEAGIAIPKLQELY
jgi:hypothetical protein